MAYTVADYIIDRLKLQGVDTLFGVPSVYCARVYAAASRASQFRTIVTSSDLEAGYAADGYARIRGLSAVAVSYGPGTLSLVNAVAGAYVERSPIVVINGGPSTESIKTQTNTGVVFSHSIGKPHTDLEVFSAVTAYHERVENPAQACSMFDEAVRVAMVRKRPVYIEIPQGMLASACPPPTSKFDPPTPPGNAIQVADQILQAVARAKSPFLIVGVEVQRYGLAGDVLAIIEKLKMRWATTLLERTTINESHSLFQGIFNGDKAPDTLKTKIWNADLLISLGAVFGSGHSSIIVPKIERNQVVRIWDGTAHVKGASAVSCGLASLIAELNKHAIADVGRPKEEMNEPPPIGEEAAWDGDRDDVYTAEEPEVSGDLAVPAVSMIAYNELFEEIERSVTSDPKLMLIADTFLGIYPTARIKMVGTNIFMAGAIWASIGHSVGAGVGVSAAEGKKGKRAFVVCGDGGFQMVAQSLSTMARYRLNTITLVVDNTLYGYEQFLLDKSFYTGGPKNPLPYAVLNDWDYGSVARGLGIAAVYSATSGPELAAAISAAKAQDGPAFIHASVGARSLPPGL
ncbi:thiamine pyrophosphate-binding protein [Rhizobium sp. FKY42]|uniref:thiamine pyrophosphate-binding protein n=1 Tax=Rhizobium sp. FKY42 TaxID=2562310 RepID=UPI0010C0AF2B|nr:thiamine pyrophosphate-binding protein [Rhizobium sp. FKY42]